MTNQTGTLESIAILLAQLLEPLRERLSAGQVRLLFAELGLQFPLDVESVTSFRDAAQNTIAIVEELPKLASQLVAAVDAEDTGQILALSLELLDTVRRVIQQIEALATALKNAGAATSLPAADVTQFADELPGRLLEYLVARNLEILPGVAETLDFIGALERIEGNAGSTDPAKPPFIRRELHVDQLADFLNSPVDHFNARYGWGSPTFDGVALLEKLGQLLIGAGVPAILDPAVTPPVLDVYFVEMQAKTDISPRGLSIRIADSFQFDQTTAFEQDDFKLEAGFDAEVEVGTEIILRPDDAITIIPPSTEFQGEAFIRYTGGKEDGDPYLILGQPNASRVEARQFVVRIGAGINWMTDHGEGTFSILGEVKKGKIFIGTEDSDGFLSSILSGIRVESDFDFGVGFSTKEGIFFTGSSTLEIRIPMHVNLGPIDLNALTMIVGMAESGFPIGLGVDIKALLGPLQVVVERIGINATLSLPPERDGNLGPVDFDLGFLPPLGAGLSIDTGVVKGGGYLRFDPDREQYDGMLELDLSGIVSVKAIALITTRMPDGSQGFSLLMIITAEFGSPIQLGFGFTLSGVGGLLGLNRTMRLEEIATGIRDGGINSIMFPQNVIENAPRIISDLKKYFPVEEGTFLIGPMVKIGWETPNLITVSLGIIIEIPGNIAILGVLKVALPDEEAALIVIQVNFMGAIEFDKKRLWFFASLFDSRVLFLTLEGQIGLLVGWSDDASFVVSVGGFHPAFNPPPLPFGSIARIAISILNTDFARIRVKGYFAVTSNTVQFGAAVELYFGVSAFNIDGHLAFDALFRFSPFYFIISISASLSVKVFGIGFFSVRMRGSLEGPTPWHVEGTGSISILFFSIDVDFSHTWGNEADTTLPPISVMPLLVDEFQKHENWLAVLPASSKVLVSIREVDQGTTDLLLHPVGRLKVSQRAVPLELAIDKVGNQKPSDANRFNVAVSNPDLEERSEVLESFAAGQFFDRSDSELLSARSFEPMKGGVDLSSAGEQYQAPAAVKRVVRYEKIIIDTYFKRFVTSFYTWFGNLFSLFLNGNAVSKSALSYNHQKQRNPFADQVEIGNIMYTVAFTEDNTAFSGDDMTFTSQAQAQDFMQQQIAGDANLATQLHVIPEMEMQRTE